MFKWLENMKEIYTLGTTEIRLHAGFRVHERMVLEALTRLLIAASSVKKAGSTPESNVAHKALCLFIEKACPFLFHSVRCLSSFLPSQGVNPGPQPW